MMSWTDDPVADAERYYADQERRLAMGPRCSECDECIQSDYCYRINDVLICEDCIENYRVNVEDL